MSHFDPITENTLQRLNRQRFMCRLLSALFCIPVLFFMIGPEKRFATAREMEDAEADGEAVSSMWAAALIGTCIGVPMLVMKIMGMF